MHLEIWARIGDVLDTVHNEDKILTEVAGPDWAEHDSLTAEQQQAHTELQEKLKFQLYQFMKRGVIKLILDTDTAKVTVAPIDSEHDEIATMFENEEQSDKELFARNSVNKFLRHNGF